MKSFEELYNEFQNNKEVMETATEAKKVTRKRNTIILSIMILIDIVLLVVFYLKLK